MLPTQCGPEDLMLFVYSLRRQRPSGPLSHLQGMLGTPQGLSELGRRPSYADHAQGVCMAEETD
jgi:hypothetical protein